MRYLITMTVDIEEIREKAPGRKGAKEPVESPRSEPTEQKTPMPTKPMAYGVKDAAEILGISRSSIYTLLREGLLSPVRIGRRLLFTEGELKALLEKNRGR